MSEEQSFEPRPSPLRHGQHEALRVALAAALAVMLTSALGCGQRAHEPAPQGTSLTPAHTATAGAPAEHRAGEPPSARPAAASSAATNPASVPGAVVGDEDVLMPAGGVLAVRPQPTRLTLDLERPFELQLGVGSGRDGLSIFALGTDGTLTVYYPPHQGLPERGGTLQLSPGDLSELVALVRAADVTTLARAYSSGTWDGGQQLLYVAQDGHEQMTYCDNAFPARFRALRDALRSFVAARSLGRPRTTPSDWERANRALWDTLTALEPR